MKQIAAVLSLVPLVSACATSQGALGRDSIDGTFTSAKRPGEVAGCVQQSLNWGPQMGTDGVNFWVTRQNGWNLPVVRYDFKPNPSGSGTIVEYRSRLKINNGLGKVKACL